MREIQGGKREGGVEQRGSTIFVDNLPNGIRKGFVHNLFSKFGRVWDCYIPNKRSRITGQSFGFIRFESARDASVAVQSTNGYWIWGQELVVNLAKFLKKQDRLPDQIYNLHNQGNPNGGGSSRFKEVIKGGSTIKVQGSIHKQRVTFRQKRGSSK